MRCIHPIVIKNKEAFQEGFKVPCGRCRVCRKQRAQEWANRLWHESGYHKTSSFITLTYDPVNTPENGSLKKGDLQKFIKRLRKDLRDEKIKYFAAGEYGSKTWRPHYHLIIFGIGGEKLDLYYANKSTISSRLIEKLWPFGFNVSGSVTPASVRYVSGYIQKTITGKEKGIYKKLGISKPFQLQSKGIGYQFMIDNQEQIKDNLYITYNGIKASIPRYYVKKLELSEVMKEKALKREEELKENYEKNGLVTENGVSNYLARTAKIRDEILKAKNDLQGGKI